MRTLREFVKDERGQDLVEYALLAAFVSIASVTGLRVLGPKISGIYTLVGSKF